MKKFYSWSKTQRLAQLVRTGDFWGLALLSVFSVGQIALGLKIAVTERYHPTGPKFTPIDGPDARILGFILLAIGLVMTPLCVIQLGKAWAEVE